jgi:cystathionine beta-lyase family protein involved in aluminum resistance
LYLDQTMNIVNCCCRELPLAADGKLDWEALASAIKPGVTKVAHIQRSCGYALRPTLTVEEIGRAVKVCHMCCYIVTLIVTLPFAMCCSQH